MKDHAIMLLLILAMLAGIVGMFSLLVYDYGLCRDNGHSVFYCLRNR